MLFSTHSSQTQKKMGKILSFLLVNLSGASENCTWAFLGKQNWRWLRVSTQNASVCTFNTSSCVPAPRAHVETHVRVVPVHTGTFWTYSRRRFVWTHGVFQRATPHAPPRPCTQPTSTHEHPHPHTTHTNNTQQHTTHRDTHHITRRQRQRPRMEREKRRRKRR